MEPTYESEPVTTELPAPVAPGPIAEASPVQAPEAAYAESQPGQVPVDVPQMGQPIAAQVASDDSSGPVPSAATTSDDTALIADDADLIEKEWVTRAKAIVEQTKENPFEQNKAITKVKADYIKKRYNKDLKVSEG